MHSVENNKIDTCKLLKKETSPILSKPNKPFSVLFASLSPKVTAVLNFMLIILAFLNSFAT